MSIPSQRKLALWWQRGGRGTLVLSVALAVTGVLPCGPRAYAQPAQFARAVQAPRSNVGHPRLRDASPVMQGRLGVWSASGQNATAFRFRERTGREWIMRALSSRSSSLGRRYARILAHLRETLPELATDVEFTEQGLRTTEGWHPAVVAPFIAGDTLERFVAGAVERHDTAALGRTAQSFLGIVRRLRAAGVAHGDLQHGNVMVDADGALHLIDFDGMFVPGLESEGALELGHRNYQHVQRSSTDFHGRLDDFSALVIWASLRALEADPSLWRFHDGESLFLGRRDFEAPDTSEALAAMTQSPSAEVRKLAELVRAACTAPLSAVPSPLAFTSRTGAVRARQLDAVLARLRAPRASPARRVAPRPLPASARTIARAPRSTTPAPRPLPEVSATRPALVVFLQDGGFAMSQSFNGEPISQAETAERVFDAVIDDLVTRSTRDGVVEPRIDVAGVVYSVGAKSTLRGGDFNAIQGVQELARVGAAARTSTQAEHRPPSYVRGFAAGASFTSAAYRTVRTLVQQWPRRPSGPHLVVLVHVTAGVPRDGDPRPAAAELQRSVEANGGTLLQVQVRLAGAAGVPSVAFPTSASQLDPSTAHLFEMASEVPEAVRTRLAAQSVRIAPGARLVADEADLTDFLEVLSVGTSPVVAAEP